MTPEEYARFDATGLAELVSRGESTPQELLDNALAMIDRVNPKINAVPQVLADRAREQIDRGLPDGPFRGVPFLIKEFGMHAKGVPCRMGSRLAQDLVYDYDTELMRRFNAAGLVTVGTSTTPEMAFNANTEALLYGPTRNPWTLEHSAGGSSGGSGAAVAAGIVPIAHANDGGGSIRIPAAVNGLVGMKPTRGRTPGGPDFGMLLFGLAAEFAVTRTVRDSATALDAVHGPDAGCFYSAPPPAKGFLAASQIPPQNLRIGCLSTVPGAGPLVPEIEEHFRQTQTLLEELGHSTTALTLDYNAAQFNESSLTLWATTLTSILDQLAEQFAKPLDETTIEAVTREIYAVGKALTAPQVETAMMVQNQVSRAIGGLLEQVDVLLTPGLLTDPAPLGKLDQNRDGMTVPEWWDLIIGNYSAYTPPFNTSGHPALMLPLYQSQAGLPMAMQFVGRWGAEETLYALAGQLEHAQPWAQRRAKL